MNYIIHLNKTFAIFCEDERLTPYHVSLYFSLFQYWNMAKFRNPISISRDELMRASKIGSVNTYIRSIKDLHNWNFIKYIPSYNPQKGSQVYLYSFDTSNANSNNNGSDISDNKSTDNGAKKTTGKADEKQVIPSINSLNNTNKLKHKKQNEPKRSKSSEKSLSSGDRKTTSRGTTKEKSSGKKEKRIIPLHEGVAEGRGRKVEPPQLSQIKIFFVQNKWALLEAEKFFNYYSSNGWLIGGKTPMKNWKASAANWMLNSEKFSNDKKTRAGKLNVSTDKNYNEPL